jgi:hypothetical protein
MACGLRGLGVLNPIPPIREGAALYTALRLSAFHLCTSGTGRRVAQSKFRVLATFVGGRSGEWPFSDTSRTRALSLWGSF